MGTHRALAVLLPCLVQAVAHAAPPDSPTLRLCIEESREERSAAALLARFLTTVRLEAAAGPACGQEREAEQDGSYVGHFDVRGSRVSFAVRTRNGQTLVRSVPWIAPSPTPLASLAAADRLSEFSILVDGVLAEDRSAPPPEDRHAAVERGRAAVAAPPVVRERPAARPPAPEPAAATSAGEPAAALTAEPPAAGP